MRSNLISYLGLLFVASTMFAGAPSGWKRVTDLKRSCQAYVPPDWKLGSPNGYLAVGPSGERAAKMGVRREMDNQARQVWNAYLSNGSLKVIEQTKSRWIGKMASIGTRGVERLDYQALVPIDDTFTCSAFVTFEYKDRASEAELDAAVDILRTVEPVKK